MQELLAKINGMVGQFKQANTQSEGPKGQIEETENAPKAGLKESSPFATN